MSLLRIWWRHFNHVIIIMTSQSRLFNFLTGDTLSFSFYSFPSALRLWSSLSLSFYCCCFSLSFFPSSFSYVFFLLAVLFAIVPIKRDIVRTGSISILLSLEPFYILSALFLGSVCVLCWWTTSPTLNIQQRKIIIFQLGNIERAQSKG